MTELREIADLLREIRDAVTRPAQTLELCQTEEHQPEPPSWADIPAAFVFRAQNAGGEWWAFVLEPYPARDSFWLSDGSCARICFGPPNPNWRETKQRRPEAIEPDWSKAPEWAEWWAVDPSGSAWWYRDAPQRTWKYWTCSRPSLPTGQRVAVDDFDWTQTLRQRPKPGFVMRRPERV